LIELVIVTLIAYMISVLEYVTFSYKFDTYYALIDHIL